MPKPAKAKSDKPPTPRSLALQKAAEEKKKRKLHAIAERRAKAQKMSKADYIAAIVARKFPGITAEEIAAEPDPGADEPAPTPPPADQAKGE